MEAVLDVYIEREKNKKVMNLDVVTMHLLQKKKFIEEYLYWYPHREEFVSRVIIVKMMVGLTSSYNNIHGVKDVNNNAYRNMVMYGMRINQSGANECIIIDEEPNANAVRFYLLKNYDELVWDGCTNHKLKRVFMLPNP